MNLEELKENILQEFLGDCKRDCIYVDFLNFIIDYLSAQGLLREPITVDDVEVDYVMIDRIHCMIEEHLIKTGELLDINSRKSEFLKIKGRE